MALAACALLPAVPARAEVVSRTLSPGATSSDPVPATGMQFELSIGGAVDDDGVLTEPPVLILGDWVSVADAGVVFRADPAVPGFAEAAALLTNGAPDLVRVSLLPDHGGGATSTGNEFHFFATGDPGPDFAGSTIEAIEVVVDAFDAGFTGEGGLPTYWQATYTTRVQLPEAGGSAVAAGALLALAAARRR